MKVLIIEDETKLANALSRGLRQESYATEVYNDGEDGLAAALHDEYDLMIIDRMLPGKEGLEIIREVRSKGIRTPVIVLTAKGQIRNRVEGLDAGADDYMVKPFSFEELLARIRALFRRPSDAVDTVLKVGDLTMNTSRSEVRRSKKRIKLTSTEYALLEYLMRNQGRTISKDKLIGHVWDFDADILPNTVEAHVGSLRRKIDKPFAGPELLQTIRGFGYRLEAAS